MIIKREISQTLDSIYDAALDSKCWSEVLAAAAHALNFKAGAFSHQELLPRSLNFLQFYGIETSGIEAYSAHYFSRNVWIPVMLRQPDVPVVPSAHVPFSELKRTEFYADWLRRVGFDDGVSGFVRRSDTSFIMFSLFRDSKSEPVGVEEKHNFAELLPHIRRAVEIHQRMAMTQSARDGAIAALSALNIGVILIDRARRVMFANPAAEVILKKGDALRSAHGILRAATPEATHRLSALVAAAVQTTARHGSDPGGIMPLPAANGEPLRVMVSPAPRFAMIEPSAIIFLGDPNTASEVHPDKQVARLYGLTPAETRLLGALFAGQRLADYAEATRISLNTAKTHLQRIFAKTGSTRQADLQRLFLSDPMLRLAKARETGPIAGTSPGSSI